MAYKNLWKKKAWEAARYKDPEFLAKRRAYEQQTKDRRREVGRQYRIDHADEIKARKKLRRPIDRELHRLWYHKNKDRINTPEHKAKKKAYYNKWAKEYYKKHPERRWINKQVDRAEKRRKWHQAWRERNRPLVQENIRARKALTKSTPSAKAFYAFVRSKKRIACYYCGTMVNGKDAHIDHVIALSKDGNHAAENLCASCANCNLKKTSKLPSEIRFLDQPLLNL